MDSGFQVQGPSSGSPLETLPPSLACMSSSPEIGKVWLLAPRSPQHKDHTLTV